MIAFPFLASFAINSNISFLAPTSTPFVGSSNMYTSASAISHFPIATFCWLPPDRFSTFTFPEGVLMPRLAIISFAFSFSALRSTTLNVLQNLPRLAAVKFAETDSCTRTPSFLRSSGTSASPLFTASCGDFRESFRPFSMTSPAVMDV